jgi:hypothetical protein
MAPAFPAGSKAVIEYHHGKLVPGGYYIFRFRSDGGVNTVRRFSHITLTGRWAVEMFKGENGIPSLDYFDPKYWHALLIMQVLEPDAQVSIGTLYFSTMARTWPLCGCRTIRPIC